MTTHHKTVSTETKKEYNEIVDYEWCFPVEREQQKTIAHIVFTLH